MPTPEPQGEAWRRVWAEEVAETKSDKMKMRRVIEAERADWVRVSSIEYGV
jgi:hypothetical protein